MLILHYLLILFIGIIVGFLGGIFGKGGSAIATPMLSLIGIPGFIAVAAPLPATIPGTLIASIEYWRSNLLDWQIVKWSIVIGIPSTIVGSYLTEYTCSSPLLIITGIMVLLFGLNFLIFPREKKNKMTVSGTDVRERPSFLHIRLFLVAGLAGLISGLLANSGGFLLAPSYARILQLPLKRAFACSLAVSIFLSIPGTIIHALLGHIDWSVTLVLAAGTAPSSYLGARIAIKTKSSRLERWYGLALTALSFIFLQKI